MAVPKKKTSKAKTRSRRASAWKLEAPARSLCPQCGRAGYAAKGVVYIVIGALAARVATGDGVLRLRRLQRPGGRMLEATEFFRGFPVDVGTRLPSRAMAELVSTVPFRK